MTSSSKTVSAFRKALVPHATVKAPWQFGVVAKVADPTFAPTVPYTPDAPAFTCDVYLNGTQALSNPPDPSYATTGLRYFPNYRPQVGDVVLVGHGTGGLTSDRWILGTPVGSMGPGGGLAFVGIGAGAPPNLPYQAGMFYVDPITPALYYCTESAVMNAGILETAAVWVEVTGTAPVDAAFSVPGTISGTVGVFGQYPVGKATASTTSTVVVTAGTADSGSDDMTVTFYRNGSSCGTLVLAHATTYATGTLTSAGFASAGDLLQVAITTYAGSTAANIGMFWRAY